MTQLSVRPSSFDSVASTAETRRTPLERRQHAAAALRAAMIGLSVASAAAMLCLGLLSAPANLVAGVSFLLGAMIALQVTGTQAHRAGVPGMSVRYLVTMAVWAAAYVLVLTLGTAVFTAAPALFWIAGAVLVALPGIGYVSADRRSETI